MKYASLIITGLFLSLGLAAQTSSQSTAQGTAPPRQHQMMMQQHMQEMKAQIAKMQANVEQMKANAAKIKDPAARHQAELDAQMWQAMVEHMQGMQKMMSEHMMHGGMGMHHHGPMGTPPPPPNSPPPPQ